MPSTKPTPSLPRPMANANWLSDARGVEAPSETSAHLSKYHYNQLFVNKTILQVKENRQCHVSLAKLRLTLRECQRCPTGMSGSISPEQATQNVHLERMPSHLATYDTHASTPNPRLTSRHIVIRTAFCRHQACIAFDATPHFGKA